jgi:superfamily II DNA helicase RecQ
MYETDLNSPKPTIKLLYSTAEKLVKSGAFYESLQKLYNAKLIARFVIDEAHCISSWGHNFRPDYRVSDVNSLVVLTALQLLNVLRRDFPSVPIIAATALGTQAVVVMIY